MTAVAGPATPCLWCRQPLVFVARQGWLHPEGGVYMRRCGNCGWRGAPALEPDLCPSCHGAKLVDAHLATPDRSNPPADSSGLLPIRTHPRPPVPPPATVGARPPQGGFGFVQDPRSAWTAYDQVVEPAPPHPGADVVPLPSRVEFVAEIRAWRHVRVVAVRRDGRARLVHVYDAAGDDLLPWLAVDTICTLEDQAETALALEEREQAAVDEARLVGRL